MNRPLEDAEFGPVASPDVDYVETSKEYWGSDILTTGRPIRWTNVVCGFLLACLFAGAIGFFFGWW